LPDFCFRHRRCVVDVRTLHSSLLVDFHCHPPHPRSIVMLVLWPSMTQLASER
jgi:hypothetical protein